MTKSATPQTRKTKQQTTNDWSNILLDQATLAEGGILENPSEFVQRLNEMLLSLTGNASKILNPNSEK